MASKFFNYYGGKASSAERYGEPRKPVVIEPFAGGAGYSTFWSVKHVKLYDIRRELVDLWQWLIECPDSDIEELPDWIDSVEHLLSIPRPAQDLIATWLVYSGDQIGRFNENRTIDFYLKQRELGDHSIWSPTMKARIIRQKPIIANWTCECMSYEDIPNIDAHWHVDPPYQKQMKVYDKTQTIDFVHLAEWCRTRNGTIDVCEEKGADWLPFLPLHTRNNNANNKYTEMVWRKDYNPRQGDMFPIDWEKSA